MVFKQFEYGEPSSKTKYDTWAIEYSTVREQIEIVILKAVWKKKRTFCIMGHQVNIRCEKIRS